MATTNQNGAGGFSAASFNVGIDNLSPETSLPRGAVRSAINVDFDRAGKWRRRAGSQLVIAGDDIHSLWAPEQGNYAYFVQGTVLRRCEPGNPAAARPAIRSGLMPEAQMNYCEVNDEIVYSNEFQSGTVFGTIGVELPTGDIVCSALTAGALQPGVYKVGMVFLRASGEESGAVVSYFTLDQAGGISVENFQMPTKAEVTGARFFLSPPNEEVMYQALDINFTETSIDFVAPAAGRMLETEFMVPPPPSHILFTSNGRLCGASGTMLWYTRAFRYGLYKPSEDYFDFGERITMAAPAPDNNGWYVGTKSGVVFLDGSDPAKMEQNPVSELAPIEGSTVSMETATFAIKGMPEVRAPVWFTEKGWVVGLNGGVINNLVHDRLALANLGRGSAFVRKLNGNTHLMGVFRGGDEPARAAVSDSMTSEIIRNGIVIEG